MWLVGVVTQNFRRHTHLAIQVPPPPQSKSHSYTYVKGYIKANNSMYTLSHVKDLTYEGVGREDWSKIGSTHSEGGR